jgi:protein-tyrosine phosphatase
MLDKAYEEGIRIVVATPHYVAGKNSFTAEDLIQVFNEVCEEIKKSGIDIILLLGNELFFSVDLINALDKGDALTIDGTRYILVEVPSDTSFRGLWNGLNHCIFAGYIPILAHIERYECLVREPDLVEELIKLGVYTQINMSGITGHITNPQVSFCHKLLKKEWVHFLGTDSHGTSKRDPKMKQVVRYLKKKYGEIMVSQLLWENPMTMLEDKHL